MEAKKSISGISASIAGLPRGKRRECNGGILSPFSMRRLSTALCGIALLLPSLASAAGMRTATVGPVQFQFPDDWEQIDLYSSSSMSFAPPRPDEMVDTRTFPARMWMSVERASVPLEGEKLKNYFVGESTIDGRSSDWYRANFALTSSGDATFLGRGGMRFDYTSDWSSVPVRGVSLVVVIEGKIIEATMYAPPENFEKYYPFFEAVVASASYVGEQAPVRHGQSKASAARSSARSSSSVSSASARPLKRVAKPRVKRQPKRTSSSMSSVRSVQGR